MGYILQFKSLKGTDYALLIDGGGTAIVGATTSFETKEDSSTDMFTPVRTQTGTFRFVGKNDHATWLAMVPADALDKTVKLFAASSSTPLWQGFIQPAIFQNDYPTKGTFEHEIAVQCPLSVLDTIDVDTDINSHSVVTFGQLLQNFVFKSLTDHGITISGYYIQGSAAVTKSRMALKIMWANFIEIDSTGAVKPKYTYKQILEEVCKFFGYTCRMNGSYVYFTMPVDNNLGFTLYGSSALAGGDGTYSARSSFSITDAMLCNTNNHEEIHPGIGKVTVSSDINPLGNLIEIPYDELFDTYNNGNPTIIVRSVDYYEHDVYCLIRQPNTDGGTLNYENDTISLSCYAEHVKDTGDYKDKKKYCRFLVYDDNDVGNPDSQEIPKSKMSYSWRKCIELFHSYNNDDPNTNTMFRISSKQVFVISDGILYINFKVHQVSAWIIETDNPYATAKIKLGNLYWNGSVWTTTDSTFQLKFDAAGAKTTRTSPSDPQYDGFGIPVTNTMRGILEFSIIDVPKWQKGSGTFPIVVTDLNGFLPLMDFEIGFVRGTIEDTRHRGNEYVKTGGNFRENVNVDLIFASDVTYGTGSYLRHMPAGVGYILNANEKPTANIQAMSGTSVIAEEELARLMAKYGEHTHRLVELDLRTNILGNITPRQVSNVSEAGLADITNMFPLAISHNWREDITTLTLISV